MSQEPADGKSLVLLRLLLLLVPALGCGTPGTEIRRDLTFEEIDPSIYFPESPGEDPFASVYENFRRSRAEHMADPDRPPAIDPFPSVHRNDGEWDDQEKILRFDWPAIGEQGTRTRQALAATVRARRAFEHPDLRITEMMLAPGARLFRHAVGTPGVALFVGGEAHFTVEGTTRVVGAGARVKLEPYVVRAARCSDGEPCRWLWIEWAPGGDPRYIDAGYYLTGANQHVQPAEATLPPELAFWRPPSALGEVVRETFGPVQEDQMVALAAARRAAGEEGLELYPDIAVFGHEGDVAWLDLESLQSSNLMWAKDVLSTGALLERWGEVARLKPVFQARRPDGSWEFNISQQLWGSGARYVEHSHSIPEFYYMLSGEVEHWSGDQPFEARPGDVFMTNSYQHHQSRVRSGGDVWRSFGATWVPGGDRSVFERPTFLVELFEGEAPDALGEVAFH